MRTAIYEQIRDTAAALRRSPRIIPWAAVEALEEAERAARRGDDVAARDALRRVAEAAR